MDIDSAQYIAFVACGLCVILAYASGIDLAKPYSGMCDECARRDMRWTYMHVGLLMPLFIGLMNGALVSADIIAPVMLFVSVPASVVVLGSIGWGSYAICKRHPSAF